MKVNELRIGNYLLCGNKTDLLGDLRRVVMVLGVDNSSIMYCENYETSGVFKSSFLAENFSPIPLTEEWLVRFGFVHDTFGWYSIKIETYCYLSIGFKKYPHIEFCENICIYDHDFDRAKICQHVHTLQNLYFALTGEELTLDK